MKKIYNLYKKQQSQKPKYLIFMNGKIKIPIDKNNNQITDIYHNFFNKIQTFSLKASQRGVKTFGYGQSFNGKYHIENEFKFNSDNSDLINDYIADKILNTNKNKNNVKHTNYSQIDKGTIYKKGTNVFKNGLVSKLNSIYNGGYKIE